MLKRFVKSCCFRFLLSTVSNSMSLNITFSNIHVNRIHFFHNLNENVVTFKWAILTSEYNCMFMNFYLEAHIHWGGCFLSPFHSPLSKHWPENGFKDTKRMTMIMTSPTACHHQWVKAQVLTEKKKTLSKISGLFILFVTDHWGKPAHLTMFANSSVQPVRRFHTQYPGWSRGRSGTAQPWGSGREETRLAGSPAGGPSCDGSGCMCKHGGGGGCRGGPVQVSASFTHTHTYTHMDAEHRLCFLLVLGTNNNKW